MSARKMQCGVWVLSLVTCVLASPGAEAAKVTRSILKSYFESGDVPTQNQFSNLIDSFISQTDDGLTLTHFGTDRAGTAFMRLDANVEINETTPDNNKGQWRTAPVPNIPPIPGMNPSFGGRSGFLPLQYADSAGQAHYGYLQITMEGTSTPGGLNVGPNGPAIFVEAWAWETSANATITTVVVPEPASAALLLLAVPFARRRRA